MVDLARGHVAALDHLDDQEGLEVFNLGAGTGTSVPGRPARHHGDPRFAPA